MEIIVRARAPLRLGFSGGGTDVPPYCDLYGGFVLNATIDKYAYTTIETCKDGMVHFIAADQGQSWTGEATDSIPLDGTLNLHKGTYNRVVKDFNHGNPIGLRITTYSDAPPGSGLGSSSTLVVAMVKAFVELLNLPLGEYEVAKTAYVIERLDVGLNGGKQDQYAATFGGFNFMEFYAEERVVVNPLRVKNWIISELESSLLLFYTGVSRSSAEIIDEQTKNITDSKQSSISAMHELKEESLLMKEGILKGDFNLMVESMRSSWEAKKRTASNISSDHIEQAYEAATKAGARAGKVSGAGGGGFMMFFVDPPRRIDVIQSLESIKGQIHTCHFTKHGTEGWRIR